MELTSPTITQSPPQIKNPLGTTETPDNRIFYFKVYNQGDTKLTSGLGAFRIQLHLAVMS